MKILANITCYNISGHALKSWKVAALKLVQKASHAPDFSCSQLIINKFQILRPATPWKRVKKEQ